MSAAADIIKLPDSRPDQRSTGTTDRRRRSSPHRLAIRVGRPSDGVGEAVGLDESGRYTRFRPSQADAFRRLRSARYGILNAPTGWGKSLCLAGLVADDLSGRSRKAIIAIPQRIISKGFVRESAIELPTGRRVRWGVSLDLCAGGTRKVERLRDFITAPPGRGVADRVAVATHVTLAHAIGSIEEERRASVLRNTTLVIDEAHHILASDASFNRLGQAIHHALGADDPSVRILLSTAYFFRGDRLAILDEADRGRFERYHVPFDGYWDSLRHIKSYSYDFIAYRGTVWEELDALLRRSQEPTIIFCPPEGHRLHLGRGKAEFVSRLASLIERHYPEATLWSRGGSVEGAAIVDLVDTANRPEKIAFIMEQGDRVAAVLAVGMFREGADWVQASRVIDLVPSGSDQDRNQRFGRLIRDHEGKRHVSYYSFFPLQPDAPSEERRRQFSRLFAHFHASLVLQNAINPVRVRAVEAAREKPSEGTGRSERFDPLGRLDSATQEQVVRGCYDELLRIASEKEVRGEVIGSGEAEAAIMGVLDTLGIGDGRTELARQIVLLIRRQAGQDIDERLVGAGFDKVWSSDCLEGVIAFSGGVGGPTTFRELRRVFEDVYESRWHEMYEMISSLPQPPDSLSGGYHWCTHNKVLHAQGSLPKGKIDLLERIDWWAWQEDFGGRWQRRYREIAALKQCPKSGTPDYDWVRQQRRLRDSDRLPGARASLCEAIPWWTWNNYTSQWDECYQRIKVLGASPKASSPDYEWAKYQRQRRSLGKLSSDRAQLLEAIAWWKW